MIGFFTIIPMPQYTDVTQEEFGKALGLAPLVGGLLGGILALIYWAISFFFPQTLAILLIVIAYIILTGGLHLDGLGDTFDGLFSNRTKERMLEIMRDSRLGTNAVLAIFCVLLVDYVALSALPREKVVACVALFPVLGRLGSVSSAGLSTYARAGEGLGKAFIDFCGLKEIVIGLVITLVFTMLLFGGIGLLLPAFVLLFCLVFIHWVTAKIGGMTGDTCGAACELTQMFSLLLAVLLFK
ncbi:MAG: adenosylcobinamide-GDP ribazoletransferase [Hyphomonadaceae bacterium]|nr:adenosylcobinamide-GDP ribazoletransferase [Clostridia bacterium]